MTVLRRLWSQWGLRVMLGILSLSFVRVALVSVSASVEFDRVLRLDPHEGVFAYARISPNGRFLVYASERDRARAVTLVDLTTKRILFSDRGIDAFFSPDGKRFIYLSTGDRRTVSIYHLADGSVTRDVAPAALGDYYSWGFRGGKHLILTIRSNYYYLDGDKGMMPASRVPPCGDIGVGERPLLSRDGNRITTFVRGTIVVRNLTDCAYIFDTGMQGAKADLSWDGRYVAFHAPKAQGDGYDIQVVDLKERTARTITDMQGSSYFPSWTRDGRLSFRYDGPEFRGFMIAKGVLSAPERPLPTTAHRVSTSRAWSDIFPETPRPSSRLTLVLIWSTWSAHSPDALTDFQVAMRHFAGHGISVGFLAATEPGSLESDVARLLERHNIVLPRIPLAAERLHITEASNQIPTTLLFRNGELIDRRLGAQSFGALKEWVEDMEPEDHR